MNYMKLLVDICSSDMACKIISQDGEYNVMTYEQKINYLKNRITIHSFNEAFDPWCYIAGYIDFKNQFWDFEKDTLNEEFACYVYIEHGFKVGLKRNMNDICRADAKYLLKPKCNIAIIGNAPISEVQQDEINTYDIIVRTNNCDSFRQGDRVDLIYYRGVRLKSAKDFPFHIVNSGVLNKVLHIDGSKSDEDYFHKKTDKWHFYQTVKSTSIDYQKNKDKHRPSCGYFTIRHVQSVFKESAIYLYGFTFNVIDPRFHNLKYEREQILRDKSLHYIKPDTKSKKVHHGT